MQFKDKATRDKYLRGFQLLIFRALVENASESYPRAAAFGDATPDSYSGLFVFLVSVEEARG